MDQQEPTDPTCGSASAVGPKGDLPPEAERIAHAKAQAIEGRKAAGLPPVDDGPFGNLGKRKKRKGR